MSMSVVVVCGLWMQLAAKTSSGIVIEGVLPCPCVADATCNNF